MSVNPLSLESCRPRHGAADATPATEAQTLLQNLPGWQLAADGKGIARDFTFKNFHHTLGFINAVGYIANREDHHPDLEAGYGHCRVFFSTHDVGGLSRNDFICAAKVNALIESA
ncbi:MAG TPA: 4a-hydroxytetrahydrobiopterin dehydratase [Rhodanobacteraceae bacterium]|nr:4a-hydroxytetrahydrobiopterin dehydratase [Rhodanobacteraceae bacterium]